MGTLLGVHPIVPWEKAFGVGFWDPITFHVWCLEAKRVKPRSFADRHGLYGKYYVKQLSPRQSFSSHQ